VPNVFRCQFDAFMIEVELHEQGEVEETGVELAGFRDPVSGPGIRISRSTRLAPPQSSSGLKRPRPVGALSK